MLSNERRFHPAIPSRRLGSWLARRLGIAEASPSPAPLASSESPEAILVRILSSDLFPADVEASTLQKLRFILEHEPDHPGLQKRWLLNRIQDPGQRQALILLLNHHRQPWQEIRFDPAEYATCWSDLGSLPKELHPWRAEFANLDSARQAEVHDYIVRSKHLYLRNRNAARNYALLSYLQEAPWVFPWEGDCLLTAASWSVIRSVLSVPGLAYLAVSVTELEDPVCLMRDPDLPPSPSECLTPQFGFARAARLHFDPLLREGPWMDHPLMKRLALPRRWLEPSRAVCAWEEIDLAPSLDADRLIQCGWTFRWVAHPSGQASGFADPNGRLQQQQAIRQASRRCDMAQIGAALESGSLRCWTDLRRAASLAPELAAIATRVRALNPESVTDKRQMLPGTQEPSRTYRPDGSVWPLLSNPQSGPGAFAPLLLDAASQSASIDDRGRLQRMIASVCALVLDGHLNNNRASPEHACRLLERWFLDPATAVLPDGVDDAAVEFRDLYPLLDAIVLLQSGGWLSGEDRRKLEEWFDGCLGWLADTSAILLFDYSERPGVSWHHLLMLAIACFLGRRRVAAQVIDNLPGLLAAQFRPDGSPRTATAGAHLRQEHLFNLQAWSNLVVLCSTLGRDLWRCLDSNGHGLQLAFTYARSHLPSSLENGDQAIEPTLWLGAMEWMAQPGAAERPCSQLPPLMDERSGLPLFWTFSRSQAAD